MCFSATRPPHCMYRQTERRETKWLNLLFGGPSARGEGAGPTGPRSHLTNRRLIRANYETSPLRLGDGDRSRIPHLWNRVCLMNNAVIISAVDHTMKIHSAGGARPAFRRAHGVSHNDTNTLVYLSPNFPPICTINESNFSLSQLSGSEQVGLLKSHRLRQRTELDRWCVIALNWSL